MIPHDFFPPESKSYERAILLLYYGLGITDMKRIVEILNYENHSSVYRVIRKYRNVMKERRVFAHRQRLIGKAWFGV